MDGCGGQAGGRRIKELLIWTGSIYVWVISNNVYTPPGILPDSPWQAGIFSLKSRNIFLEEQEDLP